MKVQALLKRAKVGSFIQVKVLKIVDTNISKLYKYNDSVIKHPQVSDESQRTSIIAQAIYESQLLTMLRILQNDPARWYPKQSELLIVTEDYSMRDFVWYREQYNVLSNLF